MDHVAESLLTAVLAEIEIPRQQMRRNIYQQIVAHEGLVSNAVTTPEAQEKAIEEFRTRFRTCLEHEASKADAKTASHLREVVKIFAGDRV